MLKQTARHLTEIIVNKFDQLMRDSQYKITKEHKPKFDFDYKAVAKKIVDTYIDTNTNIGDKEQEI